jgi:hypothetical protein
MSIALLQFLRRQSQLGLSFFLTLTAFSTYFCVYALRKPFTAATYEGIMLWGVDYKIILVVAHVLGYATSKGLGIKVISEVKPERRAPMIVFFVATAQLSLLLFALVPPPYNCLFMYLNGLPLGMIYGLIFGYLEGRRVTEILGAGLCVSFIVSSGVVKSVGRWLIESQEVSDFWMPFWAGLIFLPGILLAVWFLSHTPAPTPSDEALRTARVPMTATDRRQFFWSLAPGLVALIVVYILITILRDVRDNFAVEIFGELQVKDVSVFSITETIVGVSITVLVGLLFVMQDNRKALWVNLLFVGVGAVLIITATWLIERQQLSPVAWMTLVGLGVYLAYVPYNCTLFERLIAVVQQRSNVGFVLYMADFAGYMGSVAIVLYKNFGTGNISWLRFYTQMAYVLPLVSVVLLLFVYVYFKRKLGVVYEK